MERRRTGRTARFRSRWVVRLLATLTVFAVTCWSGTPPQAFADDPVPPMHQKILTQQPDGTYDVTLSVKGAVDSSVTTQYADVLMVLDTSSSMRWNKTPDGSETRLEAAKRSVNQLAATLLGQNTASNPDIVNMALNTFDNTSYHKLGWTNNLATYQAAVNNIDFHVGTNWEAALLDAKEMADARSAAVGRPVYVIFVTDGNPTQTIAGGPNGWPGEAAAYAAARPYAKAIVDAGYKLYTVGVYGSISNLEKLTNYAYTGNENTAPAGGTYNYPAFDTAAFQAALAEIAGSIHKDIAYKGVSIHDAINTDNVSYANGGVQPEYVLKKTLANGTVITYDSTIGVLSGGSWNYALPVFSGNSVSWPSEANPDDLLTDGAVYSITFKVKPTQRAFDAMAKGVGLVEGDNDSDGVNESEGLYSNDNDNAYVRFRTVITTIVNGQQTSTTTDPVNTAYSKPVIPTIVSSVTVKKIWAGDEASDHLDKVVTVQLKRTMVENGVSTTVDYGDPITLDSGNDWSKTVTVPVGLADTTWSVTEIDPVEEYDTSYGDSVAYAAYGNGHVDGDGDGILDAHGRLDVTNTFKVYDLIMYKTSSTDGVSKSPLEGAEFTVFEQDGVTVVRPAAATGADGKVTFADLKPGTYIIRETKVPAGYQKLSGDLTLTIDVSGTISLNGIPISSDHQGQHAVTGRWFQIDVDNHVLGPLPLAGGMGILPFWIMGAALTAFAVSILISCVQRN